MRHVLSQLVEALRYNPKGLGFDFQWCHWHNPSCRTVAFCSTQPLREMSNMNISWGLMLLFVGFKPYQLHVPIVFKTKSLSLPETSSPVQTSAGIVWPLCKFKIHICVVETVNLFITHFVNMRLIDTVDKHHCLKVLVCDRTKNIDF